MSGRFGEVEQHAVFGALDAVEVGAHPLDLLDTDRDLVAGGGAGDGGGGVVEGMVFMAGAAPRL